MRTNLSETKYRPDINGMKWSVWSAPYLAFRTAPVFTVIQLLAHIVNGLLPAVTVLIQAAFVDTAIAVVAGQKEAVRVVVPLGGIFACLLWQHLSEVFIKHGQGIRRRRMGIALQTAFVEKISRIAYHRLEMPQTQDLLRKAAVSPEEVEEETFENLSAMGILFLQNLSVLAIVAVHVWWAGFLLAGGAVLLIRLSLRAGDANYQSQSSVVEKKRRYEYISRVIMGREAVLERTLFSYVPFLNRQYEAAFHEAYEVERRALGRGMVRMKAGGAASVLPALLATFLLLPGVRSGSLSTGMYISIVNAVFSLVKTMTWNLSWQMEKLAQNRAKAGDMAAFCALPEEEGETQDIESSAVREADVKFESLEFVDVRFCYPGSSTYVLDGVSFRIEAGKHYAFAGRNGAGKSTVIRLMTGLYPEYEGEILINGRNLKNYSRHEIRNLFACVWQDYARYSMTLRENLQFSRHCSDQELEAALSGAGLTQMTAKLPDGLDTVLGKLEEGGTDLSGGQWQRIAIARAVLNGMGKGKAFILDEPAAALDPVAENQVYRQFAESSRGQTAFFITHRLGAVRDADEILLIADGKIAEKGSHEELMRQKGIYEEMYVSQRGWYL